MIPPYDDMTTGDHKQLTERASDIIYSSRQSEHLYYSDMTWPAGVDHNTHSLQQTRETGDRRQRGEK